MLERSMDALKAFLGGPTPFDYIGTRLHGGIYALLHNRRSLIIEIDNRAAEIAKDTYLPTVKRGDIDSTKAWIRAPFRPKIQIDSAAIVRWKNQFAS